MSLPQPNIPHRSIDSITKGSSHSPVPSLLPSPLPKDDSAHPADTHLRAHNAEDAPTTSKAHFTPFFTLIEDAHTTEHHHPTVHYIFSDDDTDLITEAALRTLEPAPSSSTAISADQDPPGTEATETAQSSEDVEDERAKHSALPPPRPGVTERYVLLDVSASGDAVISAHSLTADWLVLNVDVSDAPTWDAEGETADEKTAGLMLRIEGTEGVVQGDAEGREGDMEDLVVVFEKRMAELRTLISAGEKEAGTT